MRRWKGGDCLRIYSSLPDIGTFQQILIGQRVFAARAPDSRDVGGVVEELEQRVAGLEPYLWRHAGRGSDGLLGLAVQEAP